MNTLYLNIFLITNIIIFLSLFSDNTKEKKIYEYFVKLYLVLILFFFLFQIIFGVFLRLLFNFKNSIATSLFFFIAFFLLTKIHYKDLKKSYTYSFSFFLLVSLIFVGIFFFSTPVYSPPLETANTVATLIALLLMTIIPIAILGGTSYTIKRRRVKKEEELKYLYNYFLIAILFFFILSMIGYSMWAGQSSDQQIELDAVGDIISAIMNEIIYDGMFQVFFIFIVFGAVIRGMGTGAYRMFGGLVVAFLPMFLWLTYMFEPPPRIIIQLFGDFEWFGKFFYVIIATMMIIIFLAGIMLISNITAQLG